MAEYAVFQESGEDTAEHVRLALSGLLPDIGNQRSRSGIFDSGGAVTLNSGMSVNVSPFRAWIQGVSGATQGGYFAVLDDEKILTFADGSGSNRTDLIVGRIFDDPYDTSGQVEFTVEIVQGTPGGGTPATPANAIKLAEKVITPGMSAGTGGLGTAPVDKRPPRQAAQGGLVPVLDAADRATLVAYPGLAVYRIDTGQIQAYDGAGWDTYSPDAEDTGWVTMTLPSGLSATAAERAPKYRRIGDLVFMTGQVQKTTGSWGAFDTVTVQPTGGIPSTERPPAPVEFQASGSTTARSVKLVVDDDGSLSFTVGAADVVPAYVSLACVQYLRT